MAEEAFDCKALNTLIYATPHNNIEQAVGRVLREEKRKRRVVPLIIDLQDTFSSFDKWNRIREKYYKSTGYPMKVFDVDDPFKKAPSAAIEQVATPTIRFIKDINTKEKTIRISDRCGISERKKGNKKGNSASADHADADYEYTDNEEADNVELDF